MKRIALVLAVTGFATVLTVLLDIKTDLDLLVSQKQPHQQIANFYPPKP